MKLKLLYKNSFIYSKFTDISPIYSKKINFKFYNKNNN